eukprot:1257205-Rhodomonas_salina.1
MSKVSRASSLAQHRSCLTRSIYRMSRHRAPTSDTAANIRHQPDRPSPTQLVVPPPLLLPAPVSSAPHASSALQHLHLADRELRARALHHALAQCRTESSTQHPAPHTWHRTSRDHSGLARPSAALTYYPSMVTWGRVW